MESDTWVVMNAFANEWMYIAEVDYTHGVYLGAEARVQLSVPGVEHTVVLSELCTLRSMRHWFRVWRRSCRRRRLKRERSLASRVLLQYCRGVEDIRTLVHLFLCGGGACGSERGELRKVIATKLGRSIRKEVELETHSVSLPLLGWRLVLGAQEHYTHSCLSEHCPRGCWVWDTVET